MWGGDSGNWPLPPYTIPAETFRRQVACVRKALDEMSGVYAEKNRVRTEEKLRQLAAEGHRMRHALLDFPEREKIEEVLQQEFSSKDAILNILVGEATCFPIGLCFNGDEKDCCYEDLIEKFWVTKMAVSYQLNSRPRWAYSEPFERSDFCVISAVNRDVLAQAASNFDDIQYGEFEAILEHPVGRAHNTDRLDELVRKAQDSNTLLHFFCHCDDTKLHLSEGETLDPIDLSIKLDDLAGRNYNPQNSTFNLLFLNACETGLTHLDAGFLRLATKDGICGIVTTEARVPTDFAARFGHDFLSRVIQKGQSLGTAFSALYHEHWPYSLLYSCYAEREFSIKQMDAVQ